MSSNDSFISAVDLFENQALNNPDKTAVVSSVKKYSYGTLNERADSVANYLIDLGIGREECVLIYLPRVVENYVATLGILKAGGAFVNSSVKYPNERVIDIYNQASCRFIITNKATYNENSELFRTLNIVPLIIEQLMTYKKNKRPDIAIKPNDLCYVIFTSGSTGKPKGVMIEHGNLSNFLNNDSANTETYMIYQNGSSMLAMAQFTFDMSIMETFLALCSGMTLVLATDDEILNPEAINKLLVENCVDALIITPAYANTIIGIPTLKEALSKVKVIDFGAEAFPPALYGKIREVNRDVIILNGYGPTEATISCTVKIIDSADDITIGFPNGNVSVYVIDEQLNEVARGTEGELLICGKGVGRGYINRPEETAARFVDFNGMKGYLSGDYAVMRADGDIEYRGRRDSQVKLRGLRIELGEIEQVASSHPDVNHIAAMVYDGKMLVLYYSSEKLLSENELMDYIKSRLAHYMLPDRIVRLDEMPLTSNLKIDRNALPKPEITADNIVPPVNDVQKELLDMIIRFEPTMPKSIESNIISTGISSLGLMGLIACIDSEYMVNISIGDIYENPTVAELERFITGKTRRKVFRPLDRYPISRSQYITYSDYKDRPQDMCWNLNYYYEMPLDIDPSRLARAITGAFVVHPELLSTFSEEDGELWQIPAPDELIFIPDIVKITDDEWERKVPTLGKAFDISGGNLLFEMCIYVTESRIILYVDFAHIIIDGDSLDILLGDIASLYEKKQVEPEELSAYELGFEEEKQFDNLYDDCRRYYEALIDSKVMMRPIGAHRSFDSYNPIIMRPLRVGMKEFGDMCEAYKVTPNVIASGVFGYVLAAEEGLNDSIHTVTYDNRFDSGLTHTVGYLCRNLPMYCHFDSDTEWKTYFTSVSEQLRRSMIYPATAEKYMCEARPGYDKNLVIFQKDISEDWQLDGITVRGTTVQHPVEVSNYNIVVQLFPAGDMLMAVMVIDTRLYDETYGNHFLDVFDNTLELALNDAKHK